MSTIMVTTTTTTLETITGWRSDSMNAKVAYLVVRPVKIQDPFI
jgi:hypothetical protein